MASEEQAAEPRGRLVPGNAREGPRGIRTSSGCTSGGSRGKDAVTIHSDYDCDIVVLDEVAAEYRARFGGDDAGFNLGVFGVSEFRAYAAIGSAREWDRYNFAHLRAMVDKLDGEIQRPDRGQGHHAGRRPRPARLPLTLDAYINCTRTDRKRTIVMGAALAAQLDAAESAGHLITLASCCTAACGPITSTLNGS